MRTTYQIKIMLIKELGHDVRAESERDTPIIFAPSIDLLVRVRPQQIAQQPRVRDIRGPHDTPNLFHALQIGRQSTVTAKYFLVNDSRYRQTVKAIRKNFPQLDVEAPLA